MALHILPSSMIVRIRGNTFVTFFFSTKRLKTEAFLEIPPHFINFPSLSI